MSALVAKHAPNFTAQAVMPDGSFKEIKTTQFINPMNMVGVVMSIKDSINVFDSVEQALLSEVGRGIDKNGMVFVSDKN